MQSAVSVQAKGLTSFVAGVDELDDLVGELLDAVELPPLAGGFTVGIKSFKTTVVMDLVKTGFTILILGMP
jgi:hypothetical protein